MQFWIAVPGTGARVDVHIVTNLVIPMYPEESIRCQTPIAIFYINYVCDKEFTRIVINECRSIFEYTRKLRFFKLEDPESVHLTHLLSQNPEDVPESDQSLACLDGRLMRMDLFVNENRLALSSVVRQIYIDRGINRGIIDAQIAIDDEMISDQQHMKAMYPAWFIEPAADVPLASKRVNIFRISEWIRVAFRNLR